MRRISRLIRDICIFSMLGTLMFVSKILMEIAPNIHLLGMFCMTYTIVYRAKALIPIYVYVFLNGLYAGFDVWWIPYLYIWALLWAVTMLLPKNMKPAAAKVVYPIVCCLHGALFGVLYAPAQAIMFGYSAEMTLSWIIAGIPFDILHAAGDLAAGLLVLPLSQLLAKLERRSAV